MEVNGNIKITSPEPVSFFDYDEILMHLTEDTLKTPLEFKFEENVSAYRSYTISYNWEPETEYTFHIDSAACENIFGITSREFNKKFKVREEDYYGTLTFNFTNVEMPMLVQILKNNEDEEVLRQLTCNKNGEVVFEYLAPEKYKVKVIYDENDNGKRDEGSYQDKFQPERVAYVQEVIKLRSNWSESYVWDLTPDLLYSKNVIDVELEAKKKKEAAEKARKERESERNSSPFKTGGSSTGSSSFKRIQ